MTIPGQLGYAFALSLPPAEDTQLRAWAESTPGASWDASGSHITLLRLTGSLPPEKLVPVLHNTCSNIAPFQAAFTKPAREPYWDKPGLEIVMLVGETDEDVAGVFSVRERLMASMLPEGLSVVEAGRFVPHITLTTGLPEAEALRLESAARGLDLRFTVDELVFWCGGETPDPERPADPPWFLVERVALA